MRITDERLCIGCTACMNVCPTNAIEFKENKNGFLIPVINQKTCNKCGQCKKVCPTLNINKTQTVKNVYEGWILNEKNRMSSSSGGIFSAIAENVLEHGGFVCGAYMNSKHEVEHIIISEEKELYKLSGSKYVQSNLGKIFKEVKIILEKGKTVLFSGTPCQIAGLKSFLKKKYGNLITVDIICHGVPSPKVFKDYIEQIEKEKGKHVTTIYFKDKSEGWKNPQFVIKSNDEIIKKCTIFDDIYGRSFLTNMILRESCYDCKYSTLNSQSDITLGDFWGEEKYNKNIDSFKGISIIIVHTEKGNEIINILKKDRIKLYDNVPLELAINNNYPIALPSLKHTNSDEFFSEYSKGTNDIKNLLLKYVDNKKEEQYKEKSVGILNFHYENYNYGANLVAYSLMKTIEKLGFNAKIINYDPFEDLKPMEKIQINKIKIFKEYFFKQTPKISNGSELYKLNNYFDTFIVGSDQVWRKTITAANLYHYFLDFVNPSKKILSYGASFGTDKWEGNEEETIEVKKLIKRFDEISVRENDGVNICKEIFGIDAYQTLDPTLLLTDKEYQSIIDFENHDEIKEDYAAYYFLFDKDRNNENSQELKNILQRENLKIINVKGKDDIILGKKMFVYNSISQWLNYIKNSKLVITDSYHGVLFAIIYRKPFICITKNCTSFSRFNSLFSIFNIKDSFFNDFSDIKDMKKVYNINYNIIESKLQEEKEKSISFLEKALKESFTEKKLRKMEEEWINLKEVNSSKNERISNLEIYYVELNEKYIEQCKKVENMQFKYNNINDELKSMQIMINKINEEKNEIKQKLIDTQDLLKNKEEEIKKILNSTSWKLTKPIRKIKNLTNKFKDKGEI